MQVGAGSVRSAEGDEGSGGLKGGGERSKNHRSGKR